MGTPAGFAPMKECFKCSCWFGKCHKMDTFTKLGEPTIRAACTPQTVLGWDFSCLFCFFYQYLAIFPTKCAYFMLHLQALTECSPLDFRTSSIPKIAMAQCAPCPVLFLLLLYILNKTSFFDHVVYF